jgi:hypothetical protein
MAYITKANAASIVKKTDLTKIDIKGQIYKAPIFFFSRYEANQLLVIKEFIKDPEHFFKELYVALPKSVDTLSYVYEYEGKKPAYHKVTTCERLLSYYENFSIPSEIKEKGKEAVIDFRKWFKSVEHLFLTDKEAFTARLLTKYQIVTNPAALKEENSGVEYIANLNFHEVEKKIDVLIKEAGKYYYESTKNTAILKRFSDKTFLAYRSSPIENNNTGYTDEEVRDFLRVYDKTFKAPLRIMLREYYRIQYNPDLDFNGMLLDKLGFKPCSECYADGNYADELEIPSREEEVELPSNEGLPF